MNERAPAGLGASGKALWKGVVSKYELRVDELQMLEDMARSADAIAGLQKVINKEGYMAAGSMGQDVVHPAVQEIRQQRNTLRQLSQRLDLPDADTGGRTTTKDGKRTAKATNAARVRWSA